MQMDNLKTPFDIAMEEIHRRQYPIQLEESVALFICTAATEGYLYGLRNGDYHKPTTRRLANIAGKMQEALETGIALVSINDRNLLKNVIAEGPVLEALDAGLSDAVESAIPTHFAETL